MADARIFDYTDELTVKDLTAYQDVDKSTYTNAKKATGNVLRKFAINSVDATGSATATCDFTNYEQINLIINQATTITLTVPNNTKVILKIIKGATDTFNFYQTDITHDGLTLGLTKVFYEITNYNSEVIIRQLNNQQKSINNSSILTSTGVTVSAGGDFDFYVNGKVATFYGNFDVTKIGSNSDLITLNYTKIYDFVNSVNPGNASVVGFACSLRINETFLQISSHSGDFIVGTTYRFYLSASIILE